MLMRPSARCRAEARTFGGVAPAPEERKLRENGEEDGEGVRAAIFVGVVLLLIGARKLEECRNRAGGKSLVSSTGSVSSSLVSSSGRRMGEGEKVGARVGIEIGGSTGSTNGSWEYFDGGAGGGKGEILEEVTGAGTGRGAGEGASTCKSARESGVSTGPVNMSAARETTWGTSKL